MFVRNTLAATSITAVTAGALCLAPSTQAATVYTLEPLQILSSDPVTKNLFNGAMCALPNTCVAVDYPSTLWGDREELLDTGAAALDGSLRGDGGTKVGFGHSMGAQVIARWLRNYADDPGAPDPATTSFLMVGNPENTYGVPWVDRMPVDTDYQVTSLWAQYDGWADWPARFDLLAMANALYGMQFVHPSTASYADMDLDDPAIISWQDGNTTYRMRTTDKLPILDPLRNVGLGFIADAINDPLQAQVESAYDRPRTQAEADQLTAQNSAPTQRTATLSAPAADDDEPPAALAADSDAGSSVKADRRSKTSRADKPARPAKADRGVTTDSDVAGTAASAGADSDGATSSAASAGGDSDAAA